MRPNGRRPSRRDQTEETKQKKPNRRNQAEETKQKKPNRRNQTEETKQKKPNRRNQTEETTPLSHTYRLNSLMKIRRQNLAGKQCYYLHRSGQSICGPCHWSSFRRRFIGRVKTIFFSCFLRGLSPSSCPEALPEALLAAFFVALLLIAGFLAAIPLFGRASRDSEGSPLSAGLGKEKI